jgi:hypothetical protein
MIPEKYSELEARENLPFFENMSSLISIVAQEKRKKTKKDTKLKTIFSYESRLDTIIVFMLESVKKKLEEIQIKFSQMESELSKPEIIENQTKFTSISKEYSNLKPIVDSFSEFKSVEKILMNQINF